MRRSRSIRLQSRPGAVESGYDQGPQRRTARSELVVLAQECRQLESPSGDERAGSWGVSVEHDAAPVSRPRYVLARTSLPSIGLRQIRDRPSYRGAAGAARCGRAPSASRHRSRLLFARDGVADPGSDFIGAEYLHQPQNLDELALALLAHIRASRRRRSVANSSGSRQPASGAAWSSALIFCSISARYAAARNTKSSRLVGARG